jgi:hypothetical protein
MIMESRDLIGLSVQDKTTKKDCMNNMKQILFDEMMRDVK